MADIGAKTIGVRPGYTRVQCASRLMMRDIHTRVTDVATNGYITGLLRMAGVLTVGVMLRLYSRESGAMLNQIKSVAGGVYRFNGLDPTYLGGYQIMALDPSTAAPYWSTLVHDHRVALVE